MVTGMVVVLLVLSVQDVLRERRRYRVVRYSGSVFVVLTMVC